MSRRSSSVGRRPSVNVHPPDLVIGIDFGMTGTAVAYASGLDKEVKVLKSWQDASNDCDKVPTAVAYKGDELVGWGFGVRDQENTAVVVKAFKGVIDQRVLAHFKTQNPHLDNQMTRYDTTAWLQDYLEQLRKHLESRLQSALPQGMSWDQSEILYLFSYPATWDHDTQSTFKKTIGKAGFDASGPHRIKVTMNEAKAAVASVFANKTLPSPGEHLIVVDIGGGMSDVGVFAVQPDKDKGPIPHLEPKFHECGINIGSSKIDEVFENKVKERLKPAIRKMVAKDVADTTVEALAAAAIRKVSGHESYLAAKHGYGGPKGSHLVRPDFPVPDAALIGDQNWKESICPLFFNKDELFGPAYESQCKEIWKLLLVCMKTLDSKDPAKGGDNDTLDLPSLKEKKLRIVLSGGMGKSPYVQDFLRKKLSELRIETPLDVADKPQLVVCRGLVESELRHLRDEDIWMYRAKVSYGVILRRAGGQEVSTTIVVSKDAQVETRQIIKVQIRIPTDDYETCELYLAQFPDHSVPRRYSFTRPNYGTARIVGPVLSSNHTGRPPVEASVFKMDPKVDVEFQFDSGHIRSTVMLEKQGQVGDDAYFGEQWQGHSLPYKLAESSATRGPIGLWFDALVNSMNSEKALKLAKGLGIFGFTAYRFGERQRARPEGATAENVMDDLKAGVDDTHLAAEVAAGGVREAREQVHNVRSAVDELATEVDWRERRPVG